MASVFLVEDHAPLRQVLGAVLSCAGHDVTLAGHGKEALERFEGGPAELVITDLFMPEMDGIELMIRLRYAFPETRVMAISGAGDMAKHRLLSEGQVLGAVEVLSKPFGNDEFLDAVERTLGQPHPIQPIPRARERRVRMHTINEEGS